MPSYVVLYAVVLKYCGYITLSKHLFRESGHIFPTAGLCLNFHTLLKTIAILVRKCLPLPNLRLNLSKRHNFNFVKLEVARIHG